MKASQHAPLGTDLPAISEPILRVQAGTHHDPFEVLGMHAQPNGDILIRAFLPAAEAVELEATGARMTRVAGTDCFELSLPPGSALDVHPRLRWQDKGRGEWHAGTAARSPPSREGCTGRVHPGGGAAAFHRNRACDIV